MSERFGRNGLAIDPAIIVDDTVRKYGTLSGEAFSNLTHRHGTPWQSVYDPNRAYITIPDELIAAHYKALAAGIS